VADALSMGWSCPPVFYLPVRPVSHKTENLVKMFSVALVTDNPVFAKRSKVKIT